MSAELVRTAKEHPDPRERTKARHALVTAYAPCVRAVTRRYNGTFRCKEDAFQEGMLGILDAIDHFDIARNVAFGYYVKLWIRARIVKFLHESRPIVNRSRAGRAVFNRGGRVERELFSQGIEPTPQKIAEKLGVKESEVVFYGIVDLDEMTTLAATTASPEERVAEEEVARARALALHRALAQLPERTRRVVENFAADDPQSYRTLGRELGISGERVRQVKKEAFQQLREALTLDPVVPT